MAYTFKHGNRPLDDYTIQRAVGSGGFGEVYYAVSDGGREVALKYLRDHPEVELRGVSHCINLKSPHLVSIFDVKKNADGEYFIIMEYCSGPSLRDLLIAEPSGFGPQKAAFFLREIGKGLAYLHDRGIVHRDLKPGNIFYDDGYVKIGDYGLSKFISVSRHSAQTASIGTVHYMAPEIGSGNYSHGVDIYALGVMLYEMLMGKVPFEGSTMAEVLMKHLTAQPELEELPQPFGHVIHKALEKDPKDRYQSVDEMVEELLDVEDVKRSLAGFSPQSLDGAVHRGGADQARSPVPSPHPLPGPAIPYAKPVVRGRAAGPLRADAPLPDRLAKRYGRISRRVEQRMAKLGGRRPRPMPPPPSRDRDPVALPVSPVATGHPRRRKVLPFVMLAAMAIGLGVLVANAVGDDDAGAAAGLLTATMSGGVWLSRRAAGWFGVPFGKNWASRVIQAGCCAPLLAIGAAPMFDSRSLVDAGTAVWFGLFIVAIFANWQKHYESAKDGGISFGSALWLGVGASVATLIAGGVTGAEAGEFALVAAGIAGVVSLVTQASGSWQPATTGQAAAVAAAGPPDAAAGPAEPPESAPPPPAHTPAPLAEPLAASDVSPVDPQDRLRRWDVTRATWGIFSFLLVGGAVITGLLATLLDDLCHADRTGILVGTMACISVAVFAVRKTTPVKQPGFLREWFKPFLITIALFGIGSLTVTMAREWCGMNGDERALSIAGEVISGLLLGIAIILGHGPVQSSPTSIEDGQIHLRRWKGTRVFWGVFAFLLMGGAVITGLLAAFWECCWRGDQTGIMVGCIACASVLIFALRKTTSRRRSGFVREWLRPFLITVSVFGLGSLTAVIARHWNCCDGAERAATASGLVMSALLLGVAMVLGRKRPDSPPFLTENDSDPFAPAPVGVVAASGAARDGSDPAEVGEG